MLYNCMISAYAAQRSVFQYFLWDVVPFLLDIVLLVLDLRDALNHILILQSCLVGTGTVLDLQSIDQVYNSLDVL